MTVRVFLSYADADADFARSIMDALETGRVAVRDEQTVAAGANYLKQLNAEIEGADSFVALMSPEYFSSRWCHVELVTAMAAERRVLPVRLRGTPEGPLALLVPVDGQHREPAEVAADLLAVLDDAA